MKNLNLWLSVFFLLVFLSTPALAGKRASVKWGKELYKNPNLAGSNNAASCISCHKKDDKKMLKKVMNMSKDELNTIINKCITGPLEGKALGADSEEMRSLRLYLNFLTDDCYG